MQQGTTFTNYTLDGIDDIVAFVQDYVITPADKRVARRDACGRWIGGPNKYTGMLQHFQLRCEDYRHCSFCQLTRARTELSKIQRAQDDGMTLYKAIVNDADWDTILHRLRRHGIGRIRYPQSDGKLLIVLNGWDDKLQLEPLNDVTEDEMGAILSDVPFGRHITGSLGYETVKEDEIHGKDIASVESISTDSGRDIERQAWELAVQDTSELDPHDVLELEQACMERMTAYKTHLEQLGATIVFSLWRRIPVQISRIAWLRYAKSGQRTTQLRKTQAETLMFQPLQL